MRITTLAVLLCLVFAAPCSADTDVTAPLPRLRLRLYPHIPMAQWQIEQLGHDVAITLADVATVTWRVCGMRQSPLWPEACDEPLGRDEVVVRLLRDSRVLPSRVLGTAVPCEGDGGALATVYAYRVEVAADRAGVPAPLLMGRVAAHEIGHLILGAGAHTADGLMRATWSPEQFQRADEWRLAPHQRAPFIAAARRREARHVEVERSAKSARSGSRLSAVLPTD